MEHEKHSHGHSGATKESRLGLALSLTLVYMVAEAIGGIFFNSLALLADSGHMLSDAMALGLSWIAIHIGKKRPSDSHTFGFRRTEILAALFNGVALWAIVGVIFYEAGRRLFNPVDVQGHGMLYVALFGLIINLAMARLLFSSASESINIRGAFLHVLSDALGSLGAVVAGVIIIFTQAHWVDPLISVLIGFLIIYSSWGLITESFHILMEGVPKGYDVSRIELELASLPGVCCVYDLHLWSINGSEAHLSAHVVMCDDYDDPKMIQSQIKSLLRDKLKISYSTIQIESTHELRNEIIEEKCRPGTTCRQV